MEFAYRGFPRQEFDSKQIPRKGKRLSKSINPRAASRGETIANFMLLYTVRMLIKGLLVLMICTRLRSNIFHISGSQARYIPVALFRCSRNAKVHQKPDAISQRLLLPPFLIMNIKRHTTVLSKGLAQVSNSSAKPLAQRFISVLRGPRKLTRLIMSSSEITP